MSHWQGFETWVVRLQANFKDLYKTKSSERANRDHTHKIFKLMKVAGNPGNLATFSEIQLQAKCFQWAWNTYPQTRRLLAAVPNGGSRNKIEAMQLKASGVMAGVHDLFFFWKGQLHWFELKVGTNRQSSDQLSFGLAMTLHGALCHEIRELEQFQKIFKKIIA